MFDLTKIKDPNTYIENIKQYSSFGIDNIVVEHRSNNPKRDFLFVNKKQGKHIPCRASETVSMCKQLAEIIKEGISKNDRVLAVSFAETATGIGALVADNVPQCKFVMQTTRENITNGKELITFEEEHSANPTHRLYTSVFNGVNLNDFDYVLFLEDEISTGRTILNFIKQFEKLKNNMKFGVASICNWQNQENRQKFNEKKIDVFCLLSGTLIDEHKKMIDNDDGTLSEMMKPKFGKRSTLVFPISDLQLSGLSNQRLGFVPNQDLNGILSQIENTAKEFNSIRVIGTEEFMYVPIKVAERLEELGKDVVCHASTRSSIDILDRNSTDYQNGICSKYGVPSPYDNSRQTYLYNTEQFAEMTILVTEKSMQYYKLEAYNSICYTNFFVETFMV